MSQTTTDRCASCGARLPADATWCTLCFASTAAPAARPEPSDAGRSAPVDHDPDGAGPDFVPDARDGAGPGFVPDGPDGEASVVADELLARLAAHRPERSRLAGLAPSSGAARAGLSALGVVLVAGLAFGLMALLGSFL